MSEHTHLPDGSDEFAAICTFSPDNQTVETPFSAVLARVREQGFPSASARVARVPQDARSPGDLLRLSDRRVPGQP